MKLITTIIISVLLMLVKIVVAFVFKYLIFILVNNKIMIITEYQRKETMKNEIKNKLKFLLYSFSNNNENITL